MTDDRKSSREPDAAWLVWYLLTGGPDVVEAAIRAIHAAGVQYIVGGYVPGHPCSLAVKVIGEERERLANLVVDVPEPPADMSPRDAQTAAIEAYRRAIRSQP